MKTKKNKTTPIDCNEASRRFADFMDNYLKGKAKEELIHHIENCRHCFDRIEFEHMLKAKIASLRKSTCLDEKAAKEYVEKILSKIYVP